MEKKGSDVRPVLFENEQLLILDQTKLPLEEVWITPDTRESVWEAIRELRVRGAPAIGVAAAWGFYVCLRNESESDAAGSDFPQAFARRAADLKDYLASSRPTAVNLFWALERMHERFLRSADERSGETDAAAAREAILADLRAEALAIHTEDEEACRSMGEYGLTLLEPGMGILTHCNAGALATARYGTCLAPIYLGQEQGYGFRVFSDETRPLLQGARLTCWELDRAGVDVTLICDNMAATVMKKGWVDAVVVGCDRLAANGDGANKIGTSQVAIMAREYGIPFYMFVPTSTIDLDTPTGDDIVIEERDGEEIYRKWYAQPMAPEGIRTFNPAFDVTDHRFITAIVTEKGIVRPPFDTGLRELLGRE